MQSIKQQSTRLFGIRVGVQEMYTSSLLFYPRPLDEAGLTTELKTTYKQGKICLIAFEGFFPVKWLVFPQVQQ